MFAKSHIFKLILENHRSKLYQLFLDTFDITKNSVVLDVGGISEGFEELGSKCQCISVNLFNRLHKKEGWQIIIADARKLPLKDGSISIGLSNSLVEHINEGRKNFSNELLRVAQRGIFVSCPYNYSPIEPHFLLPFGQFMPEGFKKFLMNYKIIGNLTKYEDIKLPGNAELTELFPKANLKKLNLFIFPLDIIITGKLQNANVAATP